MIALEFRSRWLDIYVKIDDKESRIARKIRYTH
jgi:hypothetical protein